MASPRFRDTGRFVRRQAPTKSYRPANLADLMRCFDPANKTPAPIRVRGSGSASTDCNDCTSGTIVDTTGLDRIVGIDSYNHTVTVEAGVRLGSLINRRVIRDPDDPESYRIQVGPFPGWATDPEL